MTTARLKNYRQSPRKVRLVADLVRGKRALEILPVLDILGKRAAGPIKKLIESAIANAIHNHDAKKEDLIIKEIKVDEGVILKRSRPRARGRAFPIRKRTSNIVIRMEESAGAVK